MFQGHGLYQRTGTIEMRLKGLLNYIGDNVTVYS